MGMMEWLGESMDPKSYGSWEIDTEQNPLPPTPIVWICFAVTLGALGGFYYLLFSCIVRLGVLSVLITLVASVLYLAAGYAIECHPDTTNMGLWGTCIDDPFHISDDRNRGLMFMKVVLMPGRFFGWSLVNGWRWIRGERWPIEQKDRRG